MPHQRRPSWEARHDHQVWATQLHGHPSSSNQPPPHSGPPPRGKRKASQQPGRMYAGLENGAFAGGEMDSSRIPMTSPSKRPLDKAKRNPIVHSKDRSCTDVIFFFVFIAFLAAWGVLGYFAIRWGDPLVLIHPSDSKGRICGSQVPQGEGNQAYNLTGKDFLYFFDLTKCIGYDTVFEGCPTPQVCVASCPDYYQASMTLSDSTVLKTQGMSFEQALDKVICVDDKVKASIKSYADLKRAMERDQCTSYVVKSAPVLGRCVPTLISAVLADANITEAEEHKELNSVSNQARDHRVPNATTLAKADGFIKFMLSAKRYGEAVLSDLHWASWQIFLFLLAAALIAFAWIVLMRWFSPVMVWLSICAVVLGLAAVTSFSWVQWYTLDNSQDGIDFKLTLQYKSYLRMTKLWFWLGVVFGIVFLVIVLLLLFLRSRIQVAIAMIKESSKAVSCIMSTLGWPVLPFLLQILVAVYWATVAVHLASWLKPVCRNYQAISTAELGVAPEATAASQLVQNGSLCDCSMIGKPEAPHCAFVNYTDSSDFTFYGQAFNLFAFFWALFFVSALADLVLAGAFASWYWAFKKPDDIPAMPLASSLWRALRYHLGSLAFGSLVLAVIRFVRVILEYIEGKLKGAQNPIAEFAMKALKCCFWCLEKCVRFLNRNAYIIIAIYGKSFCPAAKEAFSLLMRNIVRVWVLDKVANFLLFLGKAVVTMGIGALAYLYFSGFWEETHPLVGKLNYFYVPVVIIVAGTYWIADSFFDVYEMAVDTTFLCFLEDSERNDGTPDKPYFMSKQLMKILNKKNKFAKGNKDDKEDK